MLKGWLFLLLSSKRDVPGYVSPGTIQYSSGYMLRWIESCCDYHFLSMNLLYTAGLNNAAE